jgi:hypothetical protein
MCSSVSAVAWPPHWETWHSPSLASSHTQGLGRVRRYPKCGWSASHCPAAIALGPSFPTPGLEGGFLPKTKWAAAAFFWTVLTPSGLGDWRGREGPGAQSGLVLQSPTLGLTWLSVPGCWLPDAQLVGGVQVNLLA